MKKGRKIKALPFAVGMVSMSFCIWLPSTIVMQQTRLHLSERIRDAEMKIEGLEVMNEEIAAEVEHLRGS